MTTGRRHLVARAGRGEGPESTHLGRSPHWLPGAALGQLQPFDRGHEMEAEGRPRRFRGGPVKQSRWWRTQPGALFVTPLAHTRSYEWCPPLSDIIGGLLESRLRLDFLHEHETLPGRRFPMMVPAGERLYRRRPPDVAARVLTGRLKARLISFCWDKDQDNATSHMRPRGCSPKTWTTARCAASAEPLHARPWPDNSIRLARIDWLWSAKRA